MMQTPALWKQAGALVAAGLPGVAMLALQPIPGDWLRAHPELQLWPAWALQALLMLNPLVLLVLAAWCGALTAHRVGLYSVLASTAGPESRRKGWALAAAVGLCSGVGLVVLDQLAAPWLGAPWERFLQQGSQPSVLALGPVRRRAGALRCCAHRKRGPRVRLCPRRGCTLARSRGRSGRGSNGADVGRRRRRTVAHRA